MLKLARSLLVFMILHLTVDATLDQTYLFGSNCTKSENYTADENYQYILYNLLGRFTSYAANSSFYNSTLAQAPDRIYGLYMCRGDMLGRDCSDCVTAAKDTILHSCPDQLADIIWYDNCMVRYSQTSFFGEINEFPSGILMNVNNVTTLNMSNTLFEKIVNSTMSSLADETANRSSEMMYATRVVNVSDFLTLYALEQCTLDLTKIDCRVCLQSAIQMLKIFQVGCHVLTPSCVVRYEMYPFFRLSTSTTNASLTNTTSATIDQTEGRSHLLLLITIIAPIASLAIFCVIGIWLYKRRKRRLLRHLLPEEMKEIMTAESLEFDWSTIKGATHNFSKDKKLGEGGFGEVYKGVLEDGQQVAVKRLSKNSGQGVVEFNTEIVVVAKLQHKNLVKLFGYCLAPKEKLLIYEYLPNLSLDRFISDEDKRVSMTWEIRFKIICGVARGLLYLHEDSRLKIIHRDLKSSNILLDEGMNPKIGDFGLARLFEVDQTQGDTKRIVGTYGYMAPEYAMTGHFSTKSDVYSFGVIVLEVVSGKRNKFFGRPQSEEALLHRAWRLWNEDSPLDLVDRLLDGNYPLEEMAKCIHIGLLCIQDNANERPTMASVVAALNGQSISLPMPKAPTFFGDPMATMDEDMHYNQIDGNEDCIGYHRAQPTVKLSPYSHTGTQEITDLIPR